MKDTGNKSGQYEQIYNLLPPGHFYSPIPNLEEIKYKEGKIFSFSDNLTGIDLNDAGQIGLFEKLSRYYKELPFSDQPSDQLRYYYLNNYYSYGDAIVLFGMLRHLKPKRIIEIGSGFSSCVFLDTNERFFNNSISCTFIEPYPERLHSLIKAGDPSNGEIIIKKLDDVDIDRFSCLGEGDILFIDGSHVSKINSDVNHVLFKILPSLKPGVFVHFHDIFYPFEYPKEWVYMGYFWNEAYLLRAFLQYNSQFHIEYFSTYFYRKNKNLVDNLMPLVQKNPGASLWISKK